MQNTSTWLADKVASNPFPKLQESVETEVAIVGGGLAGILTAYVLAKAGKQVVVLQADRLAGGATAYTTAFLTQVLDTDFTDLLSMYGKKNLQYLWESHGQAIDLIENIVVQEQIECDFTRCSNYSYANDTKEFEKLAEEFEVLRKLTPNVFLKRKGNLGFKHSGFIELKNQAKFHPLKFLQGVIKAAQELGVIFHEKTEGVKIAGNKRMTVHTEDHVVRAQYAITATYNPLNNPKKTFMKKGMYVSYVYELQVPTGVLREGIYEDTKNPYHYFRVDKQKGFDRVIVGGEDNRAEIVFREQKNFNALKKYVTELLRTNQYTIVRKWSGLILEPSDGLALIGELKPGHLIATAFSGNGMTYSGISALLFKDIITGKKNKWTQLYDPTRIPTVKQLYKKARDYTQEFVNAAVKNTLHH